MLKRILIPFIIVVGVALLFWSSRFLQDIFFEAVASVQTYADGDAPLLIIIFIALSALSAMLSPFSSVPLVPAAVIIWGNSLTTVFLLSGWLIGGALAYMVGYYIGYPFVSRLSSFEKVKYYREKISQGTGFLLILMFRFAMPAEIPGYVLGGVRYHFWKYILATFLAELPFAVLTVYASEALVASNVKVFIASIIGIFAIITIMFYLFTKRLGKEVNQTPRFLRPLIIAILVVGAIATAIIFSFYMPEKDVGAPAMCTEEAKICSDGSAVGRTGPSCEFALCPKENLIVIESPRPYEEVMSPVVVQGRARGNWFFEASFPVKVIDGSGNVLGVMPVMTTEEWMTTDFVSFRAEVPFTGTGAKEGFVIFEKDNPSGLPEYADELRVPVVFR